jgi:hypothetical protein
MVFIDAGAEEESQGKTHPVNLALALNHAIDQDISAEIRGKTSGTAEFSQSRFKLVQINPDNQVA